MRTSSQRMKLSNESLFSTDLHRGQLVLKRSLEIAKYHCEYPQASYNLIAKKFKVSRSVVAGAIHRHKRLFKNKVLRKDALALSYFSSK